MPLAKGFVLAAALGRRAGSWTTGSAVAPAVVVSLLA